MSDDICGGGFETGKGRFCQECGASENDLCGRTGPLNQDYEDGLAYSALETEVATIRSDNARLLAERDRWKYCAEHAEEREGVAVDAERAALARCAGLVEVLAFYADPGDSCETVPDFYDEYDFGSRAQEAIDNQPAREKAMVEVLAAMRKSGAVSSSGLAVSFHFADPDDMKTFHQAVANYSLAERPQGDATTEGR